MRPSSASSRSMRLSSARSAFFRLKARAISRVPTLPGCLPTKAMMSSLEGRAGVVRERVVRERVTKMQSARKTRLNDHLEHFAEKWTPVFRRKCDPPKKLGTIDRFRQRASRGGLGLACGLLVCAGGRFRGGLRLRGDLARGAAWLR